MSSNICGVEYAPTTSLDTMTLVEIRMLYEFMLNKLKLGNPQILAQALPGISLCMEALNQLLKERGINKDGE